MYIFGYPANGQGVDTLGSPPKGLFQFGRDFLKKYYPELKTLNPGLPIYVRPCDGVDAKVLARYGTVLRHGKFWLAFCALVSGLLREGSL
mmetsp:Transcript_695/g.1655  ORF Transcript_695/g.1655 Transcript_695/m.1655 type:complete len:90 (+) Transcript_695:367-636(+)